MDALVLGVGWVFMDAMVYSLGPRRPMTSFDAETDLKPIIIIIIIVLLP